MKPAAGLLLVVVAMALAGCGEAEPPAHLRIEGGDAERGRRLIRTYGCGVCHHIDGIAGANGTVGPPLERYAQRNLLAGVVPNTPRFLVAWLIDPPALAPGTGMPAIGLSQAEARDMATYLYTLGAGEAAVYPQGPTLPLAGRGSPAGATP
jgi:cytochrome c2